MKKLLMISKVNESKVLLLVDLPDIAMPHWKEATCSNDIAEIHAILQDELSVIRSLMLLHKQKLFFVVYVCLYKYTNTVRPLHSVTFHTFRDPSIK